MKELNISRGRANEDHNCLYGDPVRGCEERMAKSGRPRQDKTRNQQQNWNVRMERRGKLNGAAYPVVVGEGGLLSRWYGSGQECRYKRTLAGKGHWRQPTVACGCHDSGSPCGMAWASKGFTSRICGNDAESVAELMSGRFQRDNENKWKFNQSRPVSQRTAWVL